MRCTCSSLSITHGPAISTRRLEKSANSIGTAELGLHGQFGLSGHAALPLLRRRSDTRLEKGMRLNGLALEFGMELAAEEPGMIGDLADLDIRVVGRFASDLQACGLQPVFVFPIELVAMAMALIDLAGPIGALREASLGEFTG